MFETAQFKCREVRMHLSDYLNGTLDPANAQRLRWHIVQCKDCRMIVHTADDTFQHNFRDDRIRIPSKRRAA